jgi:signal transduction histidine kinase
VWVEDDGPGISAEDLPHVFDRFYTVNRTPARQMGSGLGLAIVHELVDAMGGTVDAEPGRSGGARMVVRLDPARPT